MNEDELNPVSDDAQLLDDFEVNHWSRVFASRSRRIHKATSVSVGTQQLDAGLERRAIEESCSHAAKFADQAIAELRKRTKLIEVIIRRETAASAAEAAKGASKA